MRDDLMSRVIREVLCPPRRKIPSTTEISVDVVSIPQKAE
jgi:hypothetical protein